MIEGNCDYIRVIVDKGAEWTRSLIPVAIGIFRDGVAYLFVRRSTPGRHALLRNHRHCIGGKRGPRFILSIRRKSAFIWEATVKAIRAEGRAKCTETEKEGKCVRSSGRERGKAVEGVKESRTHCAPQPFAVTKALNSTMHPSKRTIASSR